MRQRRARVCRHCELREQDPEQRNPGKDRTAEGSHWCPIVVIGTGNVTATVVRRAQRLCPDACDAAPKAKPSRTASDEGIAPLLILRSTTTWLRRSEERRVGKEGRS